MQMNEPNTPQEPYQWLIALGSNLGDSVQSLRHARKALTACGSLRAASPIYESAPMYDKEQPRFYNAVVQLQSDLDGPTMLRRIQDIERQYGRTRSNDRRYGPRAIDLDIIAGNDPNGEVRLDRADLQIPHPRMHERAFVLVPMSTIVSQWTHPILLLSLEELLQQVSVDESLRILCTPEQWA